MFICQYEAVELSQSEAVDVYDAPKVVQQHVVIGSRSNTVVKFGATEVKSYNIECADCVLLL